MPFNDTLALVLCIMFIGVIAINGLIIYWARRKDSPKEFKIIKSLYKSARNPFQQSDGDVAELSRLVSQLKSSQPNQPESESQDEQ